MVDQVKEKILEEGRRLMEEVLIESIGRFEARRMAGLFFESDVLTIEGKSPAEWIYDMADNRARPQ